MSTLSAALSAAWCATVLVLSASEVRKRGCVRCVMGHIGSVTVFATGLLAVTGLALLACFLP